MAGLNSAIHIRSVRVAGCEGVLFELGTGEPLLLLPSMLIRARSYRRTMLALARQGFGVIAVEMPGSGAASQVREPWSYLQYADWLLALIETMKLDRPTIIGHSASAPPAVIAAARSPKAIGHVVLCGPVGFEQSHSILRLALNRAMDLPLEPGISA